MTPDSDAVSSSRGGKVIHGAYSASLKRLGELRIERQVRRLFGLRAGEMSGAQKLRVRNYAQAAYVVRVLSPFNDDGQPSGNAPFYLAAVNSERLALDKLLESVGISRAQRDQAATLAEMARYRRPS